ncbi:GNAT family N-acetyltransferase [Roseibium aggregatum]|uniref:N-acetyltransferase n=1 Tax=Roseibium aggregatum TaxID=187304 RepID=A0A926NW87_9HYPH|nr:GNAT family N-acetyltransferase [Roseibium aggregatum]MBD1544820.1 N-acetyltransferase [Roseibium aggregatum]
MKFALRNATSADLPALLDIHNDAVRTLKAIWTDKLDTLEDRRAWFDARKDAGLPVIVAETEDGTVAGYGSFGPFRAKEGYRLTMEHSIYVAPEARGKGIGKALLVRLIDMARADGYHVLVGAIDGENTASIALHRQLGFEITGRMPQVGIKFGQWLDLVLMTLVLDERPAPTGK